VEPHHVDVARRLPLLAVRGVEGLGDDDGASAGGQLLHDAPDRGQRGDVSRQQPPVGPLRRRVRARHVAPHQLVAGRGPPRPLDHEPALVQDDVDVDLVGFRPVRADRVVAAVAVIARLAEEDVHPFVGESGAHEAGDGEREAHDARRELLRAQDGGGQHRGTA
jgi:hypothetical protein